MTVSELRKGKKYASTTRRMNKERKLCNLENDFSFVFLLQPSTSVVAHKSPGGEIHKEFIFGL